MSRDAIRRDTFRRAFDTAVRACGLAAVVCGSAVVCLPGSGTARALTPPEAPARVFFSNGGRIVSMNADGSGRSVLTREGKVTWSGILGQTGDFSPGVSPDGERMVFSYINSDAPGYGDRNRLMMASADGSGAKRILRNRGNLADDQTPSWTPDGERLVAVKRVLRRRKSISSVVAVRPNGSDMETLFTYPPQVDKPPFNSRLELLGVEMSPDGSQLLVELNNVYMDDDSHLEVVELTSGKRRSLGAHTYSGSWSGDGSSIVFISSQGSGHRFCEEFEDNCLDSGDIFTVNSDGSGKQRVTTTAANEDSPSWSPDGQRILHTSNRAAPRAAAATEVYSMKPDGSCRVALTNGAPGSFSPVWGGPGSGLNPDCSQAPPPVLAEVVPQPIDSFRPVYWAGNNVEGQLLSSASADISFGYVFSYEDCDLAALTACGTPSMLMSFPVCYWAGIFSSIYARTEIQIRTRRGAMVLSDGSTGGYSGLTVLAGKSLSFILSRGNRARSTHMKLIDHMSELPRTDASGGDLPPPRLPMADFRKLKKVERTVKRLGSTRAAARRLGMKTSRVREYLRFGRRIRSVGPIRTVKCKSRAKAAASALPSGLSGLDTSTPNRLLTGVLRR